MRKDINNERGIKKIWIKIRKLGKKQYNRKLRWEIKKGRKRGRRERWKEGRERRRERRRDGRRWEKRQNFRPKYILNEIELDVWSILWNIIYNVNKFPDFLYYSKKNWNIEKKLKKTRKKLKYYLLLYYKSPKC